MIGHGAMGTRSSQALVTYRPIPMDIDARLASLSLEEKVSLLAGIDLWHVPAAASAGVGSIRMSDGPNGVRGISWSGPRSACIPCGAALGATWDPDVVGEVAGVLGKEAAARGVQVHLAPTVNLHRTPIGGRNFECFAEDPVLTANLAVAYVRGVQAHRVASCIKHFIANDTEFERNTISSEVDERTLREAYLIPFEDAVDAGVRSVMSSYNRLNGTFAGEHPWLLTTVLRDEWDFDGVVVSDWLGTHSTAEALAAGLDIEMPGPPAHRGEKLVDAVKRGAASEADVDRAARRVLQLAEWSGRLDAPELPPDDSDEDPATRDILRRAVAASAVLLKNDGLLPLAEASSVAVVGPNAATPAAHGGGSAAVRPYRIVRPIDALRERFADVRHEPGTTIYRGVPPLSGPILGPDGATLEFQTEDGETVAVTTSERLRYFWLGPPMVGVPERFKVRLSATITPEERGAWTFALTSTGPSRLFVDGELVVDNSNPQRGTSFYGTASTEITGAIELEAGRSYALVVEQHKNTSIGVAGLLVGARPPLADDAFQLAVDAARAAEVAIVVVGTNDEWESEGADRRAMELPLAQDDLVRAVAAVNPRTVVVLNTGSPVPMPWLDDVAAVLQVWFGGQELGDGLADVLTGAREPGGRLPVTFPKRLQDTPAFLSHPGVDGRAPYDEALFVGHRWYDARDIEPLFPFGHGLGYSIVDYGDARMTDGVVEVDVTNTGARETTEIVQVYASLPDATRRRPVRQLAGFTKVTLSPGATATARVAPHRRHRQSWVEGAWVDEPGDVTYHVGRSSRDVRSSVTV
jgi:beta-glucosidase